MSLITLIDRIEPYASGWSRAKILTLVQDAVDELFDDDNPGRQFIPSDNKGFPPYLITAEATYRYAITNANLGSTLQKSIGGTNYAVRAKQVLKVFVDVTNTEFNQRWVGEPYVFAPLGEYSTRLTERIEVADIPFDYEPATELDTAAIILKDNPGVTTDKYFILFTWEHPRLTAETIPLALPMQFHPAIIAYCMGQIQMFSNGKPNEFQTIFESYWKPKFRAALSGIRGRNNLQVQPLIC